MQKNTTLTMLCEGCNSPVFIDEHHESLLRWTYRIDCPRCGHEHRDPADLHKLRLYSKWTRSYQ